MKEACLGRGPALGKCDLAWDKGTFSQVRFHTIIVAHYDSQCKVVMIHVIFHLHFQPTHKERRTAIVSNFQPITIGHVNSVVL